MRRWESGRYTAFATSFIALRAAAIVFFTCRVGVRGRQEPRLEL